jgi:cytochrome c oxidase subunit 4
MTATDQHATGTGGRPHAEGGSHGDHPPDIVYVFVALILSVLTAIEVSISYIKGMGVAGNPLLLILAVMKFLTVVLFFMHLRFDNRVFRYLFFGGLVLALGVYVAVLRMFHVVF